MSVSSFPTKINLWSMIGIIKNFLEFINGCYVWGISWKVGKKRKEKSPVNWKSACPAPWLQMLDDSELVTAPLGDSVYRYVKGEC